MSQKDLAIGHATTPGVSSEGQQAAHLTMELEFENQVIWVAVLASSDGFMPDGTTASQYVVSQVYNGLTQSAQPIAARLREAIYRANLELIGAAGASADIERPQVSVLVTAISNDILHAAYVGNLVAHLWRNGVTFPLTANHPQYGPNASAQGINNQERLGMYPDMPIHTMVVEQMARSDIPPFTQERFRMGDFIVLNGDSLLIISPKEIDSHYIGETIAKMGSNSDPNVLANGLVTSPTIVGAADDVTAIVLRGQSQGKRKIAISGRLLSALLGFILFAGSFGGLLYAFPELSNRLRITAPDAVETMPIQTGSGGTSFPVTGEVVVALTVTETAATAPALTATPQATETQTATETPIPDDVTAETEPDLSLTVNINAEDIVALAPPNTPDETPTEVATATATTVDTATATATVSKSTTTTATSTPPPVVTATPSATFTPPPSTATGTFTPPPPTATATQTSTALPTNTPTNVPPTNTPTPRPTATKPTSDIKSLQLISPLEGTQANGRQKFEWTFWGTLAADQKFEVVFWEEDQDALIHGFGITGATSNTRLSVDLDELNRQLPIFRGGITYRWGVLLVTENPYTRLALLSEERVFSYGGPSGRSSPDQADE